MSIAQVRGANDQVVARAARHLVNQVSSPSYAEGAVGLGTRLVHSVGKALTKVKERVRGLYLTALSHISKSFFHHRLFCSCIHKM